LSVGLRGCDDGFTARACTESSAPGAQSRLSPNLANPAVLIVPAVAGLAAPGQIFHSFLHKVVVPGGKSEPPDMVVARESVGVAAQR
jgi:hypothetical protein